MTEEFLLCSCGSMRDYHNFRHPYTPTYTLYRKDGIYSFDVEQLPITVKLGRCKFLNCVLNENMHKVLHIEHQFSGDDIKYREGTITLPEDLVCTSCNIPAKAHDRIRHPLTCRIKLENYKEGDNICVKYREKTISELGLIRL